MALPCEAVDLHDDGTKPGTTPAPAVTPGARIAGPRLELWQAACIGWFFELRWNLRDAVEAASKPLARVLGITVLLKLLALAGTALVGVAIGLTVSGLVQNSAAGGHVDAAFADSADTFRGRGAQFARIVARRASRLHGYPQLLV